MTEKSCHYYQDRLVEAFGDELDPSGMAKLEEHMATCAECSATWQDYRSLRKGLDSLGEQTLPSDLTRARILKAAARAQKNSPEKEVRPFWKLLLSPPAMAAAMVALLVGVGLYSQKWLENNHPMPATAPVMQKAPAPSTSSSLPPPPPEKSLEGEAPRKQPDTGLGSAATSNSKAATGTIEAPKAKKAMPENRIVPAPPAPEIYSAPTGGSGLMDLDSKKSDQPAAAPPSGGLDHIAKPTAPAKAEEKTPADGSFKANAAPAGPAASAPAQQEKTLERDQNRGRVLKENPAEEQAAPLAAPRTESFDTQDKENKSQSPTLGIVSGKSSREPSLALVDQAKEKIRAGNYSSALQDLLQAQKSNDSSEIQSLIELCRNKLKPEPIKP